MTEVDLFADLSQAEIDAMELMTPARLFRAGEIVFSQSQPITGRVIIQDASALNVVARRAA